MTKHVSKVPVFILAGGLGTRLSEETHMKPKPMVEVGGIPILVHIMRYYYRFGFNDFVICAGYRSWEIKEYFLNYSYRVNHLEIDHRESTLNGVGLFRSNLGQEKWRVRVLDTGVDCMTGARLARAFDLVVKDQSFEDFAVTYGDGLSNVSLSSEFEFHKAHQKIGTVLGVQAMARFGVLKLGENGEVSSFLEKPRDQQDTINGGFFFFRSAFRDYLSAESECILERTPLERLASQKELKSFGHSGFWLPMDTLRDKNQLEQYWNSGQAPWI